MNKSNYLKEFIKYSSLNILAMMGLSCYILADTFFISKGMGADGLAALNIALPVYSLVNGCGLMLGMGGATKFSIMRGQNKSDRGNEVFTAALIFDLIFSAVFILCGTLFSQTLAHALGANEEIFAMTNTYLRMILMFSPAFLTNNILICFTRNDGKPRLAMTATLISSFSNIVLDYVFIFPLKLGIFGAVLATGLSPIISILFLSANLLYRKSGFHIQAVKPNLKVSRSIFPLGFPSLVAEISSGIVILVFNAIILRLSGNDGVAAYGVIANISLVVTAVYTGLSQGVQPLLSRSYGARDIKNAVRLLRYALTAVAVMSAAIYLIVFFLADPITSVFNSEGDEMLQSIAVSGMKIYFTAALFVGYNVVMSVYFTSTENPLPAQIISLLRGLVLIVPMAFILSSAFGISGVWLAYPVTELSVAVLGAAIYFKCRFDRQNNR